MEEPYCIKADLGYISEGLFLSLFEQTAGTLADVPDASGNAEARYQLMEGFYYHYEFSSEEYYFGNDRIVKHHPKRLHIGTISPNIFVGTLTLPVYRNNEAAGEVSLEVRSVKTGYRDDYRDMLEYITEKCTGLLLQSDSPVTHHFETDYARDSDTLYQKFAFINSVLSSEEFNLALHRIIISPVTKWKETFELKNITNTRRLNNSNIKELVSGKNRTTLPEGHFLRNHGMTSVPGKITSVYKTDTVDTPENRFVKHALEVFLKFCSDINRASGKGSKLSGESYILLRNLESLLQHSFFKEISRPDILKINSPVLQRKEGYREVLRAWLMFDLAARLVWKGGEDVYRGGKKDIAVLYEYWLFFQLLELFQTIFDISSESVKKLIRETDDGLNLQIRQGTHTAMKGVYNSGNRKFNVRFSYNRSFTGGSNYPSPGSWTTTLRPDYTLSVWPFGISKNEAEEQELIVHIHFDAKYKVADLKDIISQKSDEELDTEKTENRRGIYKNADLLKMHAYRDAIRRTGGAYIIYPGDTSVIKAGFHEIIPGLGAFAVRPSKTESGIAELRSFVTKVIGHFINRASQREKMAYKVYDIYKEKEPNKLEEVIPEAFGENRHLIPDDTYVMVGYYRSPDHLSWIKEKKFYNFRTGTGQGSIELTKDVVDASYLLIHTKGDITSGEVFRINSKGPRIFSARDMIRMNYPGKPRDYYYVIEIEEVANKEFKDCKWNFRNLKNYSGGRKSAYPFSASLTELMNTKVKQGSDR